MNSDRTFTEHFRQSPFHKLSIQQGGRAGLSEAEEDQAWVLLTTRALS